jgi:hypothetical protein
MHQHEMQQSNIYLGIYIIVFCFFWKIRVLHQQGKSHQLPYPNSLSISKDPLELVFFDVWGPAPESVGRKKYYVSFIDDYSKFT